MVQFGQSHFELIYSTMPDEHHSDATYGPAGRGTAENVCSRVFACVAVFPSAIFPSSQWPVIINGANVLLLPF